MYNDNAVLYRTNAQSRMFEEKFVTANIPYKIVGGINFYARREIKDLLSYLRLIANPSDDGALKRIINVPKRGIGEATVSAIESLSESMDQSMLITILTPGILPEKIYKKVSQFADLMRDLFAKRYELSLEMLTEYIIDAIGYAQYIVEQGDDTLETRQENIEELLGAMREHEEQITPGSDALQSFLELTALNSDADNIDESDGTVKLMTLHSAKGLEFPNVYIIGMEESIFPGMRAIGEPEEMEEERRLCYVAITRAKERLHLVCARQRMIFGRTTANRVSRFVDEIPEEHIKKNIPKGYGYSEQSRVQKEFAFRAPAGQSFKKPVAPPAAPKPKAAEKPQFSVGDRVRHKAFGDGKLIKMTPMGNDYLIEIEFDSGTIKKLMLRAAALHMVKI